MQERHAEMANDRVVLADAGLIGELTHAFCAGLSGDVVERRARQIQEDRVKRLVDDELRISLQVVEIGRTSANVRPGDESAAFPAFAVRIIAKFKADEISIF